MKEQATNENSLKLRKKIVAFAISRAIAERMHQKHVTQINQDFSQAQQAQEKKT
jgi:hypothetical protein